ncbi:tetratricopeptide repeat protein [Frigoriglobus tundricola]|uniref:Flp pilus assembly protein TadD, contains TPR repeat n=1 Tax=Frigoriglobus tundricola TaxID=2774151 RepID=A0A6M5YKZ1_9BACT|nr:tetratricopeptide repeat protein [Frigoriglobus tundricola]QJW93953.1 Flp pilus assembly protein TadD, contains TPR repeat [Frigoriglobus tundricola]
MDGRTFRRWCALGGLMAAALGCNRNATQQTPFGPMPDPGGVQMVNMPVNGSGSSRSLWGGSRGPTTPVELADNSKRPASAESLVAVADVRLEAALDEKTPGNKEALLDLARTGYQKALAQDPKSKAALTGMARYYARLGDRDRALEVYKKYLTLYPSDAGVAHEVALAHARWKDWPGAVAWCEFALKIDPENRAVKKTLGFCEAFAGRWDDAFAALCQIMPEAQARHNLAGLLDHMGHADASRVQLQLALKADPNFVPAQGFLAELDQPNDPNGIRQASDTQPAP